MSALALLFSAAEVVYSYLNPDRSHSGMLRQSFAVVIPALIGLIAFVVGQAFNCSNHESSDGKVASIAKLCFYLAVMIKSASAAMDNFNPGAERFGILWTGIALLMIYITFRQTSIIATPTKLLLNSGFFLLAVSDGFCYSHRLDAQWNLSHMTLNTTFDYFDIAVTTIGLSGLTVWMGGKVVTRN